MADSKLIHRDEEVFLIMEKIENVIKIVLLLLVFIKIANVVEEVRSVILFDLVVVIYVVKVKEGIIKVWRVLLLFNRKIEPISVILILVIKLLIYLISVTTFLDINRMLLMDHL